MVPSLRALAFFSIALFGVNAFAPARAAENSGERFIRVLIIDNAVTLSIAVEGPYAVADAATAAVISRGAGWDGSITIKDGEVTVSGKKVKSRRIAVRPESAGSVTVNGRRYRGWIEVVKKSHSRLMVINYLELEWYVKGIAVREISHYWPAEVLKAHAVVFRSYALYQMQARSRQLYDVSSDVYSQVYGGRDAERYRITDAVDQTKAEVLTYEGRVIPAFFHSTCGGHTEDAGELWNISIEPLKGVDCGYCKSSPHYRWKAVLKAEEIRKALAACGKSCASISDIRVFATNRLGRVAELLIESPGGDIMVKAKDLRQALGADRIKSTRFGVTRRKQEYVFEGTGWGHGAGLCQWGAYFMARSGFSCAEILSYYYPQSRLSRL